MNRTTYKIFILCLLSSFALQGCIAYTPRQRRPVYQPARKKPLPLPSQPGPSGKIAPDKSDQKTSGKKIEPAYKKEPPASDVVTRLQRQAASMISDGRYDLASSTLERGLRIAPKDAMLWSQLAEVKLQQENFQQARSLAAKSNSLAGRNKSILGKNQRIINEALKRSGEQ